MWRKLLLVSGYCSVGILVVAAFAISIARGYPSLYQHYLPTIQGKLSSIIGKPVHAQDIRIDWYGYTPLITVHNLAIYSDDTRQKQLLFTRKALLSIDIYASLMRSRLTIHQLTLIGSNLEAVRTADQRIILNSIDISERIANREKIESGNKVRISLLQSTITIKDEIKDLDYFFDHVDITFGFDEDRVKVSSNFLLPETLGDTFALIADVKGFDQGLENVTGSLYIKGDSINLELIEDFFPQLRVGLDTGISNFEVWGRITSSTLRSFRGALNFKDLRYRNADKFLLGKVTGDEITNLATQFLLEGTRDDWHLALFNSHIQAADKPWPGRKYEISCTDCTKEYFSAAAALGYVDLADLFSTLRHFPNSAIQIEQLLTKVQITGVLRNLVMSGEWFADQLAKYSFNSVLQDMQVVVPEQEFEISSLSGEISGNHLRGNMAIKAKAVNFQANKIVDYAHRNQKITGTINWQRTGNGIIAGLENVLLLSAGFGLNLQGSIQIDDGTPYLDLQGAIPRAQLDALKTYLPFKKMRPKLTRWLKEGVDGGTLRHGRFLFQGNPQHFPFADQSGVFEAFASVEGGSLNYRKDWPIAQGIDADFIFKNEHLTVKGHSGTILHSSIHQVTATIDDLKLPRLVMDGKVSASAEDILDFLQQSALIPKTSQIPKHISAHGNVDLDLNIILTLTKKLDKERLVNGEIEFKNTAIMVTSVALPFTDLNGKLRFNHLGAEGQGLSAKLFGFAFNADARRMKDGYTGMSIAGDFDIGTYLKSKHAGLGPYIEGTAPILATIGLPRFGKHAGDKSLHIDVESKLDGVLLTLPEPFQKMRVEQQPLRIQTRYQIGQDYPLSISYADHVFMQALLDDSGKEISAMEVRIGDEQFHLPEQGLKISGVFDRLDIAAWQEVLRAQNRDSVIELSEINIQANTVSLSNLDIKDVDLRLQKDSQFWRGEIHSSLAKGKFNYPLDPAGGDIATASFDYLHFSKPENKPTTALDPRNLPALKIHTQRCQFEGYSINNVELITEPSVTGMTINSLSGKGDDLQITTKGTWDIDENDVHTTRLDISLATQNLHNSLTGLGFETGASKGEGTIAAQFNWPDAPYRFSLDSFLGTARLRFQDGEITSVEPGGAGRLIGLFNLGEISRRLSLDFTDFFSKGYIFDKLRGDLHFKNADLTTENLSIRGPSADILIQGRAGIVAKDYDQIITVTPHVRGGLPWIGLLVGGPIGAGAVIVGGKVAKKIGMDVDKVTQVKYSMTGSWDAPKVDLVDKQVAKENSPAQGGQPSPPITPLANPSSTEAENPQTK